VVIPVAVLRRGVEGRREKSRMNCPTNSSRFWLARCRLYVSFSLMRIVCNKYLGVLALVTGLAGIAVAEEALHVYSHRHYEIDQKVNAMFTEKTGIAVKVVNAEVDQLIERLKSEGAGSPADVLVAVDAGRMQRAVTEGLLQPVRSEILENGTPEAFRDAEGYWYPFTLRARVIVVAKDRVKEGEVEDYADLAKPEWRGRVLVRSSTSGYNQSLLVSIIAAEGEAAGEAWARGIAKNLARPPQGGDRDQIKAVAAGLADAAITNSYYLGLLLNSPDAAERKAAESVRLVFPNQSGRGTHCNVSAAGVTKHSNNAEAGKKYLEFLVSPEVQKLYAEGSFEHPVSMDLSLGAQMGKWGVFKADEASFGKLGEFSATATRLFDRAGWK
jgi:iron(III) transport system substrate-binding protein